MSRRSFRSISAVALTALSVALAAGSALAEGEVPDHAGHTTQVVGISPSALLPTVKQITEQDAFGWLNYSSRDAAISFERDIVSHMTCRGPSPFQLRGDRLMAPQVPAGGYATLCSLAPGEYDYRVELAGSAKPLLGKIVVTPES